MDATPRPDARVLYWSLTGHSARLARKVADGLGTEAEAARVPAYEGALGKLRMAADFPLIRTPTLAKISAGLGDAGTVVLCGPVWGGRPAPALRALLTLPDLPGRVGLALTCQDVTKAETAVGRAEAILGRACWATIALENREEDTEAEASRIAAFLADLAR